jgi:hypothetical protein
MKEGLRGQTPSFAGDRHLLLPVLPFLVRRGFRPRLGERPIRDAVENISAMLLCVTSLPVGQEAAK